MNKLYRLMIIVLIIIIFGVVGYHHLLNISLLDSLYMTVITVSTVGFGEVVKLNNEAKVFTIILIASSLSFFAYAISGIVTTLMQGNFGKIIRRRNMVNKLKDIKDHYIICGSGEIVEQAINQFIKSGEKFVVVEPDECNVDELISNNICVIQGIGTDDLTLKKARISNAKGMLLAFNTDADNVFAALTAKYLNPKLNIVSKVVDETSEKKLLRAGVNSTINPNRIGGSRMASLLLKPNVISFFDVITKVGELELNVEEVKIEKGSELDNITLIDAKIPNKTGLKILAIKSINEEDITLNPDSMYMLKAGDIMIVIGKEEQVKKLRRISCA